MTLVLAALIAAPAVARGDADEASIDGEASGGLVQLRDPAAPGAFASAGFIGAGLRFTWGGSHNWLAWQADSYAGAVSASEQMTADAVPLRFRRGAVVAGLDAGATLRFGEPFGYAVVPTFTVAAGAQLRHFGSAPQFRADMPGQSAGAVASATEIDPAIRLAAGLDFRLGRHWLAGVRADVRQSAGLSGHAARAFTLTFRASFLWYPRWRTF